jgi:16S rRNA G966 N2-methylase RsmD
MRYLLISIFCCLISCASYTKKNNFLEAESVNEVIHNPYFSDASKDYVYKAKIDVYNKSFGGIFIVKKIAKNSHRVVFTTEMGNKIFDFLFQDDDFKVNYILEEMDKKILLNILEKDFRVLIRENENVLSKSINDNLTLLETKIVNKKYFYAFKGEKLNSISRVSMGKERVVFLFSKISDASAKNIQILHKNIKLTINLKSI